MTKIIAILVAVSAVGMWVVLPLTKGWVSIMILLLAFMLMWFGYLVPQARGIFVAIGFYAFMTGAFATYSNWLPQVRGEVPEELTVAAGDIESMTPEELSEMGEMIIFGRVTGGNPNDADVGKGQCPLCHTVSGTVRRDRGPNLTAAEEATKVPIGQRGEIRLKDARYKDPDFVQTEAFSGSGRAETALEYIAESHVCPSCFVVVGFGVKGTKDRESPMPPIHKPPTSLSIEEFIAVDTYLFMKDGLDPPSPGAIRAVYEKFIPEADRIKKAGAPTQVAQKPAGPPIAFATETPQEIIMKMQCIVCHQIPTIPFAKFGMIGPLLIEGHNAPRRIASSEYKADVRTGKASAITPKAYVMESIMKPNAHIVPDFVNKGNPEVSQMIQDFSAKFTFGALEKIADFLLTLDCDAARADGLMGPPQENTDKVCGAASKAAEGPADVVETARLHN